MSFSSETKKELSGVPMKKNCCRRAFIQGVLLFGATVCGEDVALYVDGTETAEICAKLVREQFGREVIPEKCGRGETRRLAFASKSAAEFFHDPDEKLAGGKFQKCGDCMASFFRGVFVGGGTVSAPEKKNYHLEIKGREPSAVPATLALLVNAGFNMHLSDRLGIPTVYSKDSTTIGDFLFYLGANKQAFAFMNEKINHEIKNEINRRTNCETGNIARSTASAAKHMAAIRYLTEHGRLSELGPELEYTAQMRMRYPEMSLLQLGQEMTPAVSKPGLYHRLEKISAFAEQIKEKGF